jgi:hypothetical protein
MKVSGEVAPSPFGGKAGMAARPVWPSAATPTLPQRRREVAFRAP